MIGALLTQDREFRAKQPDEVGSGPTESDICRFCQQKDMVEHAI
jgi:hypothetical protein